MRSHTERVPETLYLIIIPAWVWKRQWPVMIVMCTNSESDPRVVTPSITMTPQDILQQQQFVFLLNIFETLSKQKAGKSDDV